MGRAKQQNRAGKQDVDESMAHSYSHWLLKTEAEEWSWEHQSQAGGISNWDGVRNPQAQKFMASMRQGDLCFFYHTGKEKAIVGISAVVRTMYPDKSDESGKFGMVDIKEVCKLEESITLKQIKEEPGLSSDFLLLRQPRLSVVPVSRENWALICSLGGLSSPPIAQWFEESSSPVITTVSDDTNGAPPLKKGRAKAAKQNGNSIPVAAETGVANGSLPSKKRRGMPAKSQESSPPGADETGHVIDAVVVKKGRGQGAKGRGASPAVAAVSECASEAPLLKKESGKSGPPLASKLPVSDESGFAVEAVPVKKVRGKPAKREGEVGKAEKQSMGAQKEAMGAQKDSMGAQKEAMGATAMKVEPEVAEVTREEAGKVEVGEEVKECSKEDEWKRKAISLMGEGETVVVPQRKRRKGPPTRST